MKQDLRKRLETIFPNGYSEFYTHLPVHHPMLFGEFPYQGFQGGGVFAIRVGFYATAVVLSVTAHSELKVLLGSKILSMRNAV